MGVRGLIGAWAIAELCFMTNGGGGSGGDLSAEGVASPARPPIAAVAEIFYSSPGLKRRWTQSWSRKVLRKNVAFKRKEEK